MKKTIILFSAIILIILLVGIFKFNSTTNDILIDNRDVISWEEAIIILNSGNVDGIMQTHSLDVGLYLKDGSTIMTKEPRIDMIFDEVDKCGDTCKNIVIATE